MTVVDVQFVRHHVEGKLLVVSPLDRRPRFPLEILEQKSMQVLAIGRRPNFEVGLRRLSVGGWLGHTFPRDDVAAIGRMGEHLHPFAVREEGNVRGWSGGLEVAPNDADGGLVDKNARPIRIEAVEGGETRRKGDATWVGRSWGHRVQLNALLAAKEDLARRIRRLFSIVAAHCWQIGTGIVSYMRGLEATVTGRYLARANAKPSRS